MKNRRKQGSCRFQAVLAFFVHPVWDTSRRERPPCRAGRVPEENDTCPVCFFIPSVLSVCVYRPVCRLAAAFLKVPGRYAAGLPDSRFPFWRSCLVFGLPVFAGGTTFAGAGVAGIRHALPVTERRNRTCCFAGVFLLRKAGGKRGKRGKQAVAALAARKRFAGRDIVGAV